MHYRGADFDSARWDDFAFRPGDIVICTPSKSGTTWMQMLCALLIFDSPELPAPMDQLSPWLDTTSRPLGEVTALLERQTHRRFIKTHTPLDGVPLNDHVTYIMVGRDPRDVAVSYSFHRLNLDRRRIAKQIERTQPTLSGRSKSGHPVEETAPDPILHFIDGDDDLSTGPITLAGVLDHLRTGWEQRHLPNVTLFHYTDLSTDLTGEMRILADLLEIDVSPTRLAALAGHAHIDRMRERAGVLAPGATQRHWKVTAAFFRRGGIGEWRTAFTEDTKRRYDVRLAALGDQPVVAWAHRGRVAMT